MAGLIGVLTNPNSGKNRRRFPLDPIAGSGRAAELERAVVVNGIVL
jgi:hypothetical protein